MAAAWFHASRPRHFREVERTGKWVMLRHYSGAERWVEVRDWERWCRDRDAWARERIEDVFAVPPRR